jgi:Calcineurin-like phosphoesterase
LIGILFSGPLDIVGDIHGEIDALQDLMRVLGYRTDGIHPNGRRLVFIGDLSDRGPDSPAVLELVSGLVSLGLAQCILGNHELNLLRQEHKEGNGWYFETNHDHDKNKFLDSRALDPGKRLALTDFLAGLPIALERSDLRLVHAAWHPASIEEIRSSPLSTLQIFNTHHAWAERLGEDTGLKQQSDTEEASVGEAFRSRDAQVPFLPAVAAYDALLQDSNPISIVTSGLERVAETPFYAGGKWRMVNRYPWWQDYQEDVPVIVGHYWRWPTAASRVAFSKGDPDLFAGLQSNEFFGAKKNVYCVDFSLGGRYMERKAGIVNHFQCRLGAVSWPERELVMDDGTRMALA